MTRQMRLLDKAPGVLLCLGVALLGYGAERFEIALLGGAWVESLVMAILLGASVSLATISSAGLPLVAGIAASVLVAIAISYLIGRLLKLEHHLALLVACGNSICGNSAIVSVAPVIDAEAEDVMASIAFTAALGILVVLLLPFGLHLSGMSAERYGILSGMTVYAVPQVLAATAPAGLVSMQVGTIVKLVRVMMLAPVMFLVSLFHRKAGQVDAGVAVDWSRFLPWFIIGFVSMALMRSASLIPDVLLAPVSNLALILTIVSMAALGLSADMRTIVRSGGRVLLAGSLSLVVLVGISLVLLNLLGVR